jgi:hypothetical protein
MATRRFVLPMDDLALWEWLIKKAVAEDRDLKSQVLHLLKQAKQAEQSGEARA